MQKAKDAEPSTQRGAHRLDELIDAPFREQTRIPKCTLLMVLSCPHALYEELIDEDVLSPDVLVTHGDYDHHYPYD